VRHQTAKYRCAIQSWFDGSATCAAGSWTTKTYKSINTNFWKNTTTETRFRINRPLQLLFPISQSVQCCANDSPNIKNRSENPMTLCKLLFRVLPLLLVMVSISSYANAQDMGTSPAAASSRRATFNLFPVAVNLPCLQRDSGPAPSATVTVVKGKLNDTLTLKLRHVKSKLAFDMFTIENTPFLSDGTANPLFTAGVFGLAWYQSDVQANAAGNATVIIKTILVNQIFGFDGSTPGPTNTFNVGIWFNDPADAAACGFSSTTPFNGEHNAGPLAMISGDDVTTGLGPLCLDPNTSTVPATCNP
jgi:hypothetical protein